MLRFKFTDMQARAILEMQLQRLTGLERQKLDDEYKEIIQRIAELQEILSNDTALRNVIVKELREVQREYGDERRTEIIEAGAELSIEDLIADEDMAITVTHSGYIKRTPVSIYRAQRRGGTGTARRGAQDRRRRRSHLRRLGAQLRDDLHEQGEGLQAEGARDTGRGARPGAARP